MTNLPHQEEEVGLVSKKEECSLSTALQHLVLEDAAGSKAWGALAVANMVAILRERGYQVKEPVPEKKMESSDDLTKCVDWFEEATDPPSSDSITTLPPTSLARFQLLTAVMDQNRGGNGRVDAGLVEENLLSQDPSAFEKEGVGQLKQYLMKAREAGIPIKFDGDRDGLHQVWFKGHKDLDVAIARYSIPGTNKSPAIPHGRPRHPNWYWRSNRMEREQPHRSPFHHRTLQSHHQESEPISLSTPSIVSPQPNEISNRYRTPSERAFDCEFFLDILHAFGADCQQGAPADQVEKRLFELVQHLYDIKPGVKRFSHYLMNMRAVGAPIWFSREEDGQPKEIFFKNDMAPNLAFRGNVNDGGRGGVAMGSYGHLEDRFASLIEAYRFHLQRDGSFADGHLVQNRIESLDPDVYFREHCPTFKHLLKLARTNGLEVNWDQDETGVAAIRMRLREF